MSGSIGVIVLHDDHHVVEHIAETLEAAGDLYVAGTSPDAPRAQVVVAGGDVLVATPRFGAPVVALAGHDPIRAARAALAVGAADLLRWPGDEQLLAGAVRRAARGGAGDVKAGRLVAVAGARGGAGVSTIAAALASIVGGIVIDLDHGGQRAFAPDEVRPLDGGNLAACTPEMLTGLLAPHPGDGRCLHAGRPLEPAETYGVLRAARSLAPMTLADTGRAHAPASSAAWSAADVRVLVVPNDVGSVRAASLRLGDDPLIVVRRARRSGVAVRDIAGALGSNPIAVVPEERRLAIAADLGTLPAAASRAMRAIRAVAAAIKEAP